MEMLLIYGYIITYKPTMRIAHECLMLEKDVLGRRPIIIGSGDGVRAAYQETSHTLAKAYPSINLYQVIDCVLTSSFVGLGLSVNKI